MGAAFCLVSGVCNVLSVSFEKKVIRSNEEPVDINLLARLPKNFWLLVGVCVTMYACILPFNNIAQGLFVTTYYMKDPAAVANQEAGAALGLMFLVSSVITPLFGHFIDVFGSRTLILLGSSVMLAVAHATMMFVNPFVATVQLGAVYSVFAASLWPSFALSVGPAQVGTAYGVATAVQNLGL